VGRALTNGGRRSLAWSTMTGKGVGRWWRNLGQKDRKEMRISLAEGIDQWQSQSADSRQWVAGGPHLSVGKRNGKRGNFSWCLPFYRGRRERSWRRVPHVSVGRRRWARPVSHWRASGSPVPRSLTRGPRSVFLNRARTRTSVGCTIPWSPVNNWFSIAPKFARLCNLMEWKIRNNFPFGN
jgi:hypothetical protein